MTFHCFFEQSGTFKNEFKKLGYEAYDYDILDDFGETDYKIDLFKEIETAYEGGNPCLILLKKKIRSSHSFHVLGLSARSLCGLEDRHNNRRIGMRKRNWSMP